MTVSFLCSLLIKFNPYPRVVFCDTVTRNTGKQLQALMMHSLFFDIISRAQSYLGWHYLQGTILPWLTLSPGHNPTLADIISWAQSYLGIISWAQSYLGIQFYVKLRCKAMCLLIVRNNKKYLKCRNLIAFLQFVSVFRDLFSLKFAFSQLTAIFCVIL